ncbi:hypothetical protein ISG33_06595 [Glaciecola sp. MH2013]|uniref:hypothetical protein n=1 Tax=Glaciecola sp. MH2013 TaxID=2785524 RepID=UPI00189FA370|nr:hypothetical protein [Glaciecola sp. MH2013]MBF7073065.1 hypothetical protein [Glaciecola sp. MH2013]
MATNKPTKQSKEQSAFSESLFVATQQLRELKQKGSSSNQKLLFNDLVFCAQLPGTERAKEILKTINTNLALRSQYIRVLEQLCWDDSAKQVSASTSDLITQRDSARFSLRLKPDPINPDQVYVLLTLKMHDSDVSSSMEHGVFLHLLLDKQFTVFHFPKPIEGTAQKLIEKQSRLYTVLSHPDTHMFLQAKDRE